MCKLDNKIRTCLLALYGTYQHHNLIPASLFLGPRFTAFLLDSIAFLSNEAATRGMTEVGSCIIAENTNQGPTAVLYVGTKGPLCQQRERVRGQGIDPQQRSSQRGHSATGNTDPNRQRWNGDSSFQHRYTVSEQVHQLAADRLSNLPHTQLTVIPLSSQQYVVRVQRNTNPTQAQAILKNNTLHTVFTDTYWQMNLYLILKAEDFLYVGRKLSLKTTPLMVVRVSGSFW